MTRNRNKDLQTAPAPTDQLAEKLRTIAAHAPALIDAGVTSFTFEGMSVTLARTTPTHDAPPADPTPPAPTDPLRDPATYPGGRVPGFTLEDE